MKREDQKILDGIANNDRHVLNKLYPKYRKPFLEYFKDYAISEEEVISIYQDAMIAFYQNGVQGKLEDLTSAIKAYLFGIGKHKAIELLRKKDKENKIPGSELEYEAIDLQEKELSVEQKKLYKHFTKLGENCQSMLRMFYYRGLSLVEIVKIGNYKDENAVKSQKSKCLKKLRS